jgi:hypothetical protein
VGQTNNDKENNTDDKVALSVIKKEVELQTEKYSKSIHLVNKSNNEKRLQSKQGRQDGLR